MQGASLNQSAVPTLTIPGAFGLLWVVAIAWSQLAARPGEEEAESKSPSGE
ncbi:hypothetical protein ACFQY5_38505 [Paeniroseomonas aquatica]|uniref:Uncharacterized protein n=1 Tax=Paeniroseomonas aquatica TaxID=373043 RepID=A0ABT7ZZY1_9PROT|nr:hypothetical protein [Paeniroseomonas aquatica]MDN3563033.1 hypothetical protein [Paeniroseomonas aquatica]